MIWEFDNFEEANLAKAENLPEIILSSRDSNTKMKIKQYNCTKAHKTLGNYMSPSFSMNEQCDKLMETSAHYTTQLTTSSFSKYDTWVAYFTVYIPRMTYTLPLSIHYHKQLDKLQQMSTTATLQKNRI